MSDLFDVAKLKANLDNELAEVDASGKEKVEKESTYCKAVIEKNLAALPNQKTKEQWRGIVNGIRDVFKTKAIGCLSVHSRAQLLPKFDAIIFELPDSREEFKFRLKTDMKELQQMAKPVAKAPEIIALMASDFLFPEEPEENQDEQDRYCGQYEVKSLDDSAWDIGTGKFTVSWVAMKSPRDAKGIISHELGHVLMNLIEGSQHLSQPSLAKFAYSVDCISRRGKDYTLKPELKSLRGLAGGGWVQFLKAYHTDENWADMIAGFVADEKDENPACYLIDKENDEYADLSLKPDDEDTHAKDAFRILSIELLKNKKLPVSCESVLLPSERAAIDLRCGF